MAGRHKPSGREGRSTGLAVVSVFRRNKTAAALLRSRVDDLECFWQEPEQRIFHDVAEPDSVGDHDIRSTGLRLNPNIDDGDDIVGLEQRLRFGGHSAADEEVRAADTIEQLCNLRSTRLPRP